MPFADADAAARWVAAFVPWYNHEHQHRGIRFVTAEDRHVGREGAILAQRHAVYTQARERAPARWSGPTRDWSPVATVRLNPAREIASIPADVAAQGIIRQLS